MVLVHNWCSKVVALQPPRGTIHRSSHPEGSHGMSAHWTLADRHHFPGPAGRKGHAPADVVLLPDKGGDQRDTRKQLLASQLALSGLRSIPQVPRLWFLLHSSNALRKQWLEPPHRGRGTGSPPCQITFPSGFMSCQRRK